MPAAWGCGHVVGRVPNDERLVRGDRAAGDDRRLVCAAASTLPVTSPSRHPLFEHPWQQLLDTVKDPVVVGVGHGLVQVMEASLHQLAELGPAGLVAQHRRERLVTDVGVGHAGVGELADVGGDAVQLIEGQPPGRRARPAGDDQRPVDVEQRGDPLGHSAVLWPSVAMA